MVAFKVDAKEMLEREAKPQGNSAYVQVPRGWIGKKVKVLLLED